MFERHVIDDLEVQFQTMYLLTHVLDVLCAAKKRDKSKSAKILYIIGKRASKDKPLKHFVH